MRILGPIPLADLGPTLRAQLDTLRRPDGRFAFLLRDDPCDAITIVALDTTGVIGWSAAEPSGLLGVFVAPRHRRSGLGTDLATRARRALEASWPGVEWQALAAPENKAGRAFWRHLEALWMREAA